MNFIQLLLTSVFLNVTGNILLKKGVTSFGGISGAKANLIGDFSKAVVSPFIIGGIILYGISFFIWLRVLSFNDLSRAYPIFISFVFLFTTAGSALILKESITIMRLLGAAIIILGIYIVAKS